MSFKQFDEAVIKGDCLDVHILIGRELIGGDEIEGGLDGQGWIERLIVGYFLLEEWINGLEWRDGLDGKAME